MSLLDEYRRKLEAQMQEHKAQLDVLKARAKKVAAQSKIVGYNELAKADIHLDQVRAKFQELKGAGGHAFDDLKSGVQKALADLKVSTQKAATHFNSHTESTPHRLAKKKSPPAKAKTAKHVAKVVRHSKVVRRAKAIKAKVKAKVKAAKSKLTKTRKR